MDINCMGLWSDLVGIRTPSQSVMFSGTGSSTYKHGFKAGYVYMRIANFTGNLGGSELEPPQEVCCFTS